MRAYSRLGYFSVLVVVLLCQGRSAQAAQQTWDFSYESIAQWMKLFLFTEQGRHYLEGGPNSCSYVFLRDPRISPDGQRLRFVVRFHWSKGIKPFGQCIRTHDSFQVKASGRPVVEDGNLRLTEVRIDKVSNDLAKLLVPFFRDRLPQQVEFEVSKEISKIANGFELSGLKVHPGFVRVFFDWDLAWPLPLPQLFFGSSGGDSDEGGR